MVTGFIWDMTVTILFLYFYHHIYHYYRHHLSLHFVYHCISVIRVMSSRFYDKYSYGKCAYIPLFIIIYANKIFQTGPMLKCGSFRYLTYLMKYECSPFQTKGKCNPRSWDSQFPFGNSTNVQQTLIRMQVFK